MKRVMRVALLFAVCALRPAFAAPPAFVDVAAVRRVMDALSRPMDKWRLDRNGVRPVANTEVKKALGFN
jgi:hypothetical protein